MNTIKALEEFFALVDYGKDLEQLFCELRYTLPGRQDMLLDSWEIIEWEARPGNSISKKVDFSYYKNDHIKFLVKLCILYKREKNGIAVAAVMTYYYALLSLDGVFDSRSIETLDSDDFYSAENFLRSKKSSGYDSYYRVIQAFANWVRSNFDPFIMYVAPSKKRDTHGREGTDEGRSNKNIPDQVVASLVALAGRVDLPVKDRFYLNALVLDIVLQGRVNELATLPLICLDEDLCLLNVYSEKNGRLDVRFFPKVLLPVVKKAYEFVRALTDEGRQIVQRLRKTGPLDWSRVVQDSDALRYHVKKAVSVWVEEKKLIDPSAIWCQTLQGFVNPNDFLEMSGNSITLAAKACGVSYKSFSELLARQKAAEQGRLLFINHFEQYYVDPMDELAYKNVRKNPRAIGLKSLQLDVQYSLYGYKLHIYDIVNAGLVAQMQGRSFPMPDYCENFEVNFSKVILPVVVVGELSISEPEGTLFVVPRGLLTSQITRPNDYSLITHGMFRAWLNDSKAAEESLFSKYNIVDPRTGLVADFTWHDLRHWMQTIYMKGGLTDAQASLLAGRKLATQASVYDQTLSKDRSMALSEMRDAIREGKVHGVVPSTYVELKVSNEPAAEQYLIASTQSISWMPHGSCSLNVVLTPCQNHLSCFVDGATGGCCSKLGISSDDNIAEKELEKVLGNGTAMMEHLRAIGGEFSPQFKHFERVCKNVQELLRKVFNK